MTDDRKWNSPTGHAIASDVTDKMPSVSGMGVVAESGRCVIPEGYALVPIEPTYEMLAAGYESVSNEAVGDIESHYRAMLAAAPKVGE